MIWIWILLAVALTALFLKGKKIAPHNFMWALIPIDRFGLTVAGVTLKPIYIYSAILVMFAVFSRSFRLKIPRSVLIVTPIFGIIVVLAALFRGSVDIFEDIMIYGMFYLTAILAASSLSLVNGRDDLRQIQDVMIATAVGYGILFMSLYFLDSIGISLPNINSENFNDVSIMRYYNNMTDGEFTQLIRLRGFYLDPNAASVPFIVGFAALCGKWTKEGGGIKNIVYALIIIINIMLASSRTAIVVLALLIVMSVFRFFFARIQTTRKLVFFAATLFSLFGGFVFLIYNSKALDFVYNTIISSFSGRSGLTDYYGRFTIWKDALQNLFEGNWLTGLGVNVVATLTESKRDSHNTLLEVMCSSGIFAGVYYTMYFLYPMVFTLKRRFMDIKNSFHLTTFLFVYIGIFVMITTVSHIASVYLIYTAFLLFIIPGVLAEEEDRLASAPLLRTTDGVS